MSITNIPALPTSNPKTSQDLLLRLLSVKGFFEQTVFEEKEQTNTLSNIY